MVDLCSVMVLHDAEEGSPAQKDTCSINAYSSGHAFVKNFIHVYFCYMNRYCSRMLWKIRKISNYSQLQGKRTALLMREVYIFLDHGGRG